MWTDGVYRLGFLLKGQGLGPLAATKESFRTTGLVSRDIVTSLGNLVHGQGRKGIEPGRNRPGLVGRGAAGRRELPLVLGRRPLLALLNLLPLLPLDGGHIAFSLLEAARGRAVAREVYERVWRSGSRSC